MTEFDKIIKKTAEILHISEWQVIDIMNSIREDLWWMEDVEEYVGELSADFGLLSILQNRDSVIELIEFVKSNI